MLPELKTITFYSTYCPLWDYEIHKNTLPLKSKVPLLMV